mmetsp:Transcript_54267/g.118935  ORF Transcript_54267/g.118935 Transcript_54267/m.118935 type:complete len:427 (-) Transcript_54267:281-1561(-)
MKTFLVVQENATVFSKDVIHPGLVDSIEQYFASWMVCFLMVGVVFIFVCYGRAIRTSLKTVMDPRRYDCLSTLLRKYGIDEFGSFDMRVVVHEAEGNPKGYVVLRSGDSKVKTSVSKKGRWEESVRLTVYQGNPVLSVSLKQQAPMSRGYIKEELGSAELCIKKDIIDEAFPINRVVTLRKKGKKVGSVKLSFTCIGDLEGGSEAQPLLTGVKRHSVLQSRIQEQVRLFRQSRGRDNTPTQSESEDNSNKAIEALDGADKLYVLAQVCAGPLEKAGLFGMLSQSHFAVIRDHKRWCLAWFSDEKSCMRGAKPKGAIPMLSITGITADPNSRAAFTIRHRPKAGGNYEELILKRVDREREAWTEGLRLFIDQLRALERARTEAASSAPSAASSAQNSYRESTQGPPSQPFQAAGLLTPTPRSEAGLP